VKSKTGIIKKLDALGRFVIPTEIRKKIRIDYNSPLEVCLINETVILKKVSSMSDVYFFAPKFIDSIKKTSGTILICDEKNFFYSTDKNLINKKISDDLEKIIQEKNSLIISKDSKKKIIELFDQKKFSSSVNHELIFIITSQGKSYGAFIIFSKEKISELEIEISRFAASFFSELII
jgi:AbrB family transcriptional regulator (stage V sporulation protein T)